MGIIKKIEVKRFRSINRQEIVLDDITIFSGKNNSGKSNVLKALNLFFSKESSFGQEYIHENDYNKAFTGSAGGKRAIEITLFFEGCGNAALKEDFQILRILGKDYDVYKYKSNNRQTQSKIDKEDGNTIRQFTRFRNKLEYFYIPAVRDRIFVKKLLTLFERLLDDEKGLEFIKNVNSLSDILSEKAKKISSDFEKYITLPTSATLSTSIVDVLNAIVINVDSGIKVQKASKNQKSRERNYPVLVDLFSSGDGILMSYIPHFLSHICENISNKYFIWGFEEPENSLEYSKIQELAEKFYFEFSKKSQILITTHSAAFIKLKDKERVKFYRVYINPNDLTKSSQIKTIKDIEKQLDFFDSNSKEYDILEKELGFVELSQDLAEYTYKWQEERKKNSQEIERLKQEIKNEFPDKIFICEDKETVNFWQTLLGKNIQVYSSEGVEKNHIEDSFKQKSIKNNRYKPQVFRQIDRDGFTEAQLSIIQSERENKYKSFGSYKIKAIPVNQMENFALITFENLTKFESIVNAHSDTLQDDTMETIGARLKSVKKNIKNKSEFEGEESRVTAMLKECRKDKIRLFKGKSIAAKDHKFNAIKYLAKLEVQKYPKELVDYLEEVKKFYK